MALTPIARLAATALLAVAIALASAPAIAEEASAPDRAAIVGALEQSGAAWSQGDLDGFMRIYEAAPDTTYVGGREPVRGYDAIREMYAARFGAGPGAMGRLSLTVLDCRALGADHALVTGRFRLNGLPGAHGEAEGQFTLVFHRGATGWRIISDHSSS